MMGTVCSAEETEPGAIFEKVVAKYQSMETYSAEGTIISDIDSGHGPMTNEAVFSIKLKKPNLYLIVWSQKNATTPAITPAGAVWNDGTQPHLYMGFMKAYSKMSNDEMALAAATGISGGAAHTIPSLFLPVFKKQPAPFSRLIAPKLEGSEQVAGDDCYVIGGSSTASKKETFWISKKAQVIRKYSRSLEQPDEGAKFPELTDQQLDESIKSMGLEVTEERRQATRNMMKQAQDALKAVKLKGVSIELHATIDTPTLKEGDFAFKVPDGVVLKDSLFGGVLGAK